MGLFSSPTKQMRDQTQKSYAFATKTRSNAELLQNTTTDPKVKELAADVFTKAHNQSIIAMQMQSVLDDPRATVTDIKATSARLGQAIANLTASINSLKMVGGITL